MTAVYPAAGPLLRDEEFFLECLDPQFPGMNRVNAAVQAKDFAGARKHFAALARKFLDENAERFFSIPFEPAENVYMLPGENAADACRRVCRHQMVSCGIPHDFGQNNAIDWECNPTENQYAEWTWQLSRHNEWKLLAHEYRRTGDEALAACFTEMFDSWVKQAVWPGDVPGHETKCWRTIECGIRMGANWPYTLFSFYKSCAFTDDLLVDWYKSVWEHGLRLSTQYRIGNWLIMEMNGLGHIGMLYPMFKKSAAWLRQAIDSMEAELDRQMYPDGFQYELSTNYHQVTLNNYQRLIEAATAFGTALPQTLTKKLTDAVLLHIKLMMPDKTLPDLNDGCRLSIPEIARTQQRMLPLDGRLRWVYEGGETGKPDYTGVALPWSGQVVMRTGWTPQDTWVHFDAGPFGRGHQHEDKLSVLLYANGRLLLSEGGNYAYDDSPMRRYVLSSRAHNTVLVDGKGQDRRSRYDWKDEDIRKKADLCWHIGTEWDHAEGIYNEGYEGLAADVTHRRTVCFWKTPPQGLPPLLVVIDRLSAGEPHRFEALWHIDSPLTGQAPGRLRFDGLDVLHSAGEAQVITGCEDPVQGFVAATREFLHLHPAPCVCVSGNAAQLRMVTVLVPYKADGSHITEVHASADVQDTAFSITLDDGSTLYLDEKELAQG
ncbi:MAG: alginate lyase family protein [Oscillospiraceae bacterium]|nr:alginate lyase family protein [Oscillospiraceae bacterium]